MTDRVQNRVIAYDDVVKAGAKRFTATGTIDIQELAVDLAVSRATLYRVIPGRDRVLGDVLWGFGSLYIARATAATEASRTRGVDRLVAVLRHFGEEILGTESFRTFLSEEPDVANRVLFTPLGGVHERFVASTASLLRDVAIEDELVLPFDVDTTAYVVCRLFESMSYADLLIGREPDLDVADGAVRAILNGGTLRGS